MRIWDLDPKVLCTRHLASEHRELHGIFNIIVNDRKGYAKHPETLRWVGKLGALKLRHDLLCEEMARRGWKHKTPIDHVPEGQSYVQDQYVDVPFIQIYMLKQKGCDCQVHDLISC